MLKKVLLTAVLVAVPFYASAAEPAFEQDAFVLEPVSLTEQHNVNYGVVSDILRAAGGKDSPFDHDNGRGNDDKWRHDNGRRGNDKWDKKPPRRPDRDDRRDGDRWERDDDDDDRWDDDRWERDDDDWDDDDRYERRREHRRDRDDDDRWDDDRYEHEDDDWWDDDRYEDD